MSTQLVNNNVGLTFEERKGHSTYITLRQVMNDDIQENGKLIRLQDTNAGVTGPTAAAVAKFLALKNLMKLAKGADITDLDSPKNKDNPKLPPDTAIVLRDITERIDRFAALLPSPGKPQKGPIIEFIDSILAEDVPCDPVPTLSLPASVSALTTSTVGSTSSTHTLATVPEEPGPKTGEEKLRALSRNLHDHHVQPQLASHILHLAAHVVNRTPRRRVPRSEVMPVPRFPHTTIELFNELRIPQELMSGREHLWIPEDVATWDLYDIGEAYPRFREPANIHHEARLMNWINQNRLHAAPRPPGAPPTLLPNAGVPLQPSPFFTEELAGHLHQRMLEEQQAYAEQRERDHYDNERAIENLDRQHRHAQALREHQEQSSQHYVSSSAPGSPLTSQQMEQQIEQAEEVQRLVLKKAANLPTGDSSSRPATPGLGDSQQEADSDHPHFQDSQQEDRSAAPTPAPTSYRPMGSNGNDAAAGAQFGSSISSSASYHPAPPPLPYQTASSSSSSSSGPSSASFGGQQPSSRRGSFSLHGSSSAPSSPRSHSPVVRPQHRFEPHAQSFGSSAELSSAAPMVTRSRSVSLSGQELSYGLSSSSHSLPSAAQLGPSSRSNSPFRAASVLRSSSPLRSDSPMRLRTDSPLRTRDSGDTFTASSRAVAGTRSTSSPATSPRHGHGRAVSEALRFPAPAPLVPNGLVTRYGNPPQPVPSSSSSPQTDRSGSPLTFLGLSHNRSQSMPESNKESGSPYSSPQVPTRSLLSSFGSLVSSFVSGTRSRPSTPPPAPPLDGAQPAEEPQQEVKTDVDKQEEKDTATARVQSHMRTQSAIVSSGSAPTRETEEARMTAGRLALLAAGVPEPSKGVASSIITLFEHLGISPKYLSSSVVTQQYEAADILDLAPEQLRQLLPSMPTPEMIRLNNYIRMQQQPAKKEGYPSLSGHMGRSRRNSWSPSHCQDVLSTATEVMRLKREKESSLLEKAQRNHQSLTQQQQLQQRQQMAAQAALLATLQMPRPPAVTITPSALAASINA